MNLMPLIGESATASSTTTTTVPKLTWAEQFLTGWNPNPDTKKGSTLGGGCFYRGPLSVIREKDSEVDAKYFASFATRMWNDYDARGLFGSEMFEPTFDPLAFTQAGKNAYDCMHDTHSDLLRDLAPGHEWASKMMFRLLQSEWNNEKWGKYLRMQDDPKKILGTGGRLRTAGWLVNRLLNTLLEAHRRAKNGDRDALGAAALLNQLLRAHLKRIAANLPLTAAPKGDHLPVPHVEVFMCGILHHAAKRCLNLGIEPDTCKAIIAAMLEVIEFAHLPQFGPACYAYDVEVKPDGALAIHPLTVEPLTGDEAKDKVILGRRPNGIGGVNTWILPALLGTPRGDALVADAVKAGWPTKQTMFWHQWCT